MHEKLENFEYYKSLGACFSSPFDHSIIGNKFVFKNKVSIGVVVRKKARLDAQGLTQIEHYFDETVAPIARLEAIRIS